MYHLYKSEKKDKNVKEASQVVGDNKLKGSSNKMTNRGSFKASISNVDRFRVVRKKIGVKSSKSSI